MGLGAHREVADMLEYFDYDMCSLWIYHGRDFGGGGITHGGNGFRG